MNAVEDGPLVSENKVSNTTDPTGIHTVKEAERNGEFQLISRSKAFLVDEFARDIAGRFRVDPSGENRFVLREGFLRYQGSRQIQLAVRPHRFGAKRAQVFRDHIDLIQRESFGK